MRVETEFSSTHGRFDVVVLSPKMTSTTTTTSSSSSSKSSSTTILSTQPRRKLDEPLLDFDADPVLRRVLAFSASLPHQTQTPLVLHSINERRQRDIVRLCDKLGLQCEVVGTSLTRTMFIRRATAVAPNTLSTTTAASDASSADIVLVAEVLVTSPMTDAKVDSLTRANVPWVEALASDAMQWSPNAPLRVVRRFFAPPFASLASLVSLSL